MRHIRLLPNRACLVALVLLAATTVSARAGEAERTSPVALVTLVPSDPCGFHRAEAFGRGIMHYSTEMLWACETIAQRRLAQFPLGARLEACETALARYRAAVVGASQRAFAERRDLGWYSAMPALDEETKRGIAESTGALAALDAIRTGF